MNQLEQNVLNLLKKSRPELAFEKATDLVGEGLLDSLDIVMLTSDLESEFGINIPGEEIIPETFSSITSIAALVIRLQAKC